MNNRERDYELLLRIVRYCDEIAEARQFFGSLYEIFESNSIYRNAVALCILQIGELSGYLSDDLKEAYKNVPWRNIKDMRNMVAHKYGTMSTTIMWETITDDVPVLKDYCMSILRSL